MSEIEALIRKIVREELAQVGRAPELLTTAEAAKLARLTQETLREWIADGRLRAVRAGRRYRIARSDLEAALSAPRRRLRVVEDISPESAARRRFG